jgi:lysozyme family protein
MPILTDALKGEYLELWRTCETRPEFEKETGRLAGMIRAKREIYESLKLRGHVPWYVIGAIHCMESGLSFQCHLHNGDSLRARTKHVPQGRPADGEPPFTWEESAADALMFAAVDCWNDWTIPGMLYRVEAYNG